MYYRRMDLDVAAMISEVEARPALWDKSCKAYTDRHRRNTAWSQICKALYPDWSRLTQSQQGVIGEYTAVDTPLGNVVSVACQRGHILLTSPPCMAVKSSVTVGGLATALTLTTQVLTPAVPGLGTK
ncbi:hypothetical protein GDO81_026853 [Engystomops pustulosus]|uniref:MADF domain-containing protein n=1 Tax=Engystomops pustulosus TaxID=76066 RepID=A0AAV6YGK7_ENGPU|nr:hypothetical protein GDO81_026853 [Engystomops pustulosus]